MGFLATTETAITGGFTTAADSFGSALLGTSTSEDRVIRFRDRSTPRHRTALVGTGTGYQDTIPYITYSANPRGNVAGTVDMNGYLQWLNRNGYGINMTVQ